MYTVLHTADSTTQDGLILCPNKYKKQPGVLINFGPLEAAQRFGSRLVFHGESCGCSQSFAISVAVLHT